MRRTVVIIATVVSLGALTLAASTNAEARFGAGMIADAASGGSSAQPAQYGYGYGYQPYYGYYRPYYAPRYYAPRRYYRPRYYRYY